MITIADCFVTTIAVETPQRGPAARFLSRERLITLVAVRTSDGAIGIGESAPLPSHDHRDEPHLAANDTSLAALRALLPLELEGPGRAYIVANRCAVTPSLRFAFETALLDAFAKASGRPLRDYLHSPATRVDNCLVVDSVAQAETWCQQGGRAIKLKFGDNLQAEQQLLKDIRAVVPTTTLIRIDVNQRWPLEHVPRLVRELAVFAPQFIEEPAADAWKLLAMDLPVPIALDESLAVIPNEAWPKLLGARSLWGLVLKPTVLGGLTPALGLANAAFAAGKQAAVTHALEGPVATAACAELALALGERAAAAGLGNNPTLCPQNGAWTQTAPQLAHVSVVAPAAIGHGVAIDRLEDLSGLWRHG